MAQFEALFRHLPRPSEEDHQHLSQDSRYPGQDLDTGPPEYEAGVLTTRRRSFTSVQNPFASL